MTSPANAGRSRRCAIKYLTTKLQLEKIYTFDFNNQIQFGSVSAEKLIEIFNDGRYLSEPLTYHHENYFDELKYVDEIGYDFVHPQFNYIEQKQITSGGMKFCPSNMIGQGRRVDQDFAHQHINNLDLYFLLADITKFPIVRTILLPGLELINKCSNNGCSFTVNHAIQRLFMPYEVKPK